MSTDREHCIACGASARTEVGGAEQFPGSSWLECAGCKLLCVSPPPTEEDIEARYGGIYWTTRDTSGKRQRARWQAKSQFRYVQKHSPCRATKRPYVLEIGSGHGALLHEFARAGATVLGVEPDSRLVRLACEMFRVPVEMKMLDEFLAQYDGPPFDVILASHVLEHLLRPDVALRSMLGVLNSTGIVFLEVPNCEDPATRAATLVDVHTYGFTGESLGALLQRCGYLVAACHAAAPSPYASLNTVGQALQSGGRVASSWWWSNEANPVKGLDLGNASTRKMALWDAACKAWRWLYLLCADVAVNHPIERTESHPWLRVIARRSAGDPVNS